MPSPTRIGRYEVESALGQGAMGTVYKAVDPVIERAVAIKTINLDLSNEERAEFEARFYREAKSAGRLSHPNIVTIYDVGEVDDIAYIAMEYLEGQSLREMLDSGVVMSTELIICIAVRVAAALNYAHENGVVHRDIKPANIMITPERGVKIMDFGIAQVPTGSRTQVGTVLGSPKYMAPEQVVGHATDGRTDIFALGVVLYEMLTGTTPFNGDNLSAIMYRVLNDTPVLPSALNPRIPPVFDQVVSRALAKDPVARYQTALQFARDLSGDDPVLPPEAPVKASAAAPATKPAARPDDATVFLPPRKAHELVSNARGNAPLASTKSPLAAGNALLRRRAFWLGAPLLIAAAYWAASTSGQGDAADVAGSAPARVSVPVLAAPQVAPSGVPESATRPPQAASVAAPVSRAVAEAERPVPRVPAAEETSQAAAAQATVKFAVAPWGEVYVDGKRMGVSPPFTALQLDAGKHTLEIRNQAFAPYRTTVNLTAGQSVKIRHKFR